MRGSSGESRRLVVETLARGSITDRSGRATSILLEKCGYQGSAAGLSALLNAMERDGIVRRTLRGRRCFSITLSDGAHIGEVSSAPAVSTPPAPLDIAPDLVGTDVSALAQALLDRVIALAGTPERSEEVERLQAELAAARAEVAVTQARLYEATERAEKYRHKISALSDEVVARKVEADGLRMRLAETEKNLDQIIRSPGGVRLDLAREKELRNLVRLMKTPPSRQAC